jgi:hypothetical protein
MLRVGKRDDAAFARYADAMRKSGMRKPVHAVFISTTAKITLGEL